jgi:hypothetical protein
MQARSIKRYLVIGIDLRYLLDVTTEHAIYGKKSVLDTIKRFIDACTDSGLHVTSKTASSLYGSLVAEWEANRPSASARRPQLSVREVALLRDASLQVQTVMLAEAEGVFAHVTTEKRFAVEKLLNNVASLMSPGILSSLPDVAQNDFKEAGRCIAFELPTAAAFHLMRGTEDVLKHFYCSVVEQDRTSLMWGPMVAHLRKVLSPPPLVLLNNLDNLRTGFRNPTQHPEKIYDIEEAQDLLFLSIDAVNRMMKYLGALPG